MVASRFVDRVRGIDVLRLAGGAFVAASLLGVLAGPPAAAQQNSGAVFQQLVGIDVQAGNVGLTGCGGADAASFDSTLGGDGDPSGRPVEQRFDLFRLCDNVAQGSANGWTGEINLSPNEVAGQATALAPEELFAGIDQSAAVFDVQHGNITQRLNVLRTARRGDGAGAVVARGSRSVGQPAAGTPSLGVGSLAALAMAEGIHAQVGAEGDDGPLGFFVNGRLHVVNIDDNSVESGSDSVGGGVTLGGDSRLGSWGHAGLSFGYTYLDTQYDGSASNADLDSYAFSAYGAVYPTDLIYVDGILTGSILRFDSENDLLVLDAGPQIGRLSAETDGWTLGGSLGVGGEIPVGAVVVGPFLRADALRTHFDSFTQRGGDGTLDLSIGTQDSTSVTTHLGLDLAYAISTSIAIVTPQLRGAWVHEYDEQGDAITGNLRALPNARFRLRPTSVDRDYATLGGSLAATFPGGFSQFVDYEALLGFSNVVTHQVTLGLRFAF